MSGTDFQTAVCTDHGTDCERDTLYAVQGRTVCTPYVPTRVTYERHTGILAGRDGTKTERIHLESPIGHVLALVSTRKVTVERDHETVTYEPLDATDLDVTRRPLFGLGLDELRELDTADARRELRLRELEVR